MTRLRTTAPLTDTTVVSGLLVVCSLGLALGFMVGKGFAARLITVTIPSTAITAPGQTLATGPSRDGVSIKLPTSKETRGAMDGVTPLADARMPKLGLKRQPRLP